DTYKFARAHHTIYPGVTITRSFLYVKESQQLLIWDEATSESEHTYSQLFNLGIDVKSSRQSPSKWELTHAPSSKKLGMTVLSGSYTTYFYDGLTNPIRGFASPDYLVKKPIQQLEFSKIGKEANFATIIGPTLEKPIQQFSLTKTDTDYEWVLEFEENEERIVIEKR
ncbi:MAG: hypothetical protein ACRCWQ_10065, partial [Bacilli bacterium]